MCSDHFGIGKCIPVTLSAPVTVTWPQPYPCPALWPTPLCPPLKPKKKLIKKKKTKILIRVCGDLTGLNVEAKKKNSLFSVICKHRQESAAKKN